MSDFLVPTYHLHGLCRQMLDQEGRGAAWSLSKFLPVCHNLKPITSFVFDFESSVENAFREIIKRNIGKALLLLILSFHPTNLQFLMFLSLPSSPYLPLSNHSCWKTHSCCKFSSVLSMEGVMTGYYLKPLTAVVSACFAFLSKCGWSVEEWTHTQNISPFCAMLEIDFPPKSILQFIVMMHQFAYAQLNSMKSTTYKMQCTNLVWVCHLLCHFNNQLIRIFSVFFSLTFSIHSYLGIL